MISKSMLNIRDHRPFISKMQVGFQLSKRILEPAPMHFQIYGVYKLGVDA